jgi:hypothetical protein
LGDGSNRILRKPVFLRPDRSGVLGETLSGIQGKGWRYDTKPNQPE